MESKVFWGVLCALLMFSGVMFALFALGVVGVRAVADESSRQAIADIRQQSYMAQQQQDESQREQLARRQLSGNQRCVGGVVLAVVGSSYRQLGRVGDPVRCSGNLADRAIR